MALGDHVLTVQGAGQRVGRQPAGLRAQAHAAAQIVVFPALLDGAVFVGPFGDQGDDRMRGVLAEFGAVRIRQSSDVAGELDHRHLHAQADAQIGNPLLAGVAYRGDLAFDAALAETARYQDGVHASQTGQAVPLDLLGVDIVNVDLGVGVDAGVQQGFVQRLVGIGQIHVLADHGDVHRGGRVLDRLHHPFPVGQSGGRQIVQVQLASDDIVHALGVQQQRNPVDGIGVGDVDDRLGFDVGEQRDLAALSGRYFPIRAAQQDVGLDTDGAQFLDRVLGRLGLEFAGGFDVGHQGQMDEQRALATQLHPHLADGLQKGQRFDVAHRATDFDQGDVGLAGAQADAALDFVGDVRDHLHRAAEVVAAPLLADHVFVDAPGGEVVAPGGGHAGEAFVMTQIEIGFGAVAGHEHLAVLERAHGAGIDIDVGVELDQGDLESPGFQHGRQRGGGNALAQGGHHAAGDEDESGHAGMGGGERRYKIPKPVADGDCKTGRKPGSPGPAAASAAIPSPTTANRLGFPPPSWGKVGVEGR